VNCGFVNWTPGRHSAILALRVLDDHGRKAQEA
jgi:hypothetical protein